MSKGYVYILTNPSFREDWVKIGKSGRPVDLRSKELDNTAVPLPFEIYATIETEKYDVVERNVHKSIDRLTDLRIRQNREFFNIAPDMALDILVDIAKLLDDAVVYRYNGTDKWQIYPVQEQVPEQDTCVEVCEHRSRFVFSMIGLKAGDIITFDPTGICVKVADDRKVEYEDRLWTLSAFAATYMPEDHRNNSNSYQGPKFFSYEGKNLWEMRLEKEQQAIENCNNEE